MLEALQRDATQPGAPGLSVVRYDDRQGEIVGTTAYVTARLANIGGRRL